MPTYQIYFAGQVQGVGFRATCRHLALRLPTLVGQVWNMPDGRVGLMVRGPAEDVGLLVERLQAAFPGHVREVEQSELAAGEDGLPEGLSGVEVSHAPMLR